jgi:hippurate hydrolase
VLAAATLGRTQEPKRSLADLKPKVLAKIDAEMPDLDKVYKHLHSHPEMSHEEEATAAFLAAQMKKLGFVVTEKFGGHGIVCVLKNGDGPTVLVRTDMDALPVTEKTGLPYASKVQARDREGKPVGVMHACGHDIHMTSWIGTARVLTSLKSAWKGTLVFIGQPAEEVGAGAKLMLDAGLYSKFPKPDFAFGLHCDSRAPVGTIGYSEGLLLANTDSVDITVLGKGGHGSAPHTTVDPIVLAARIILDLQMLVSRENNPLDPAVITVGSIHGGTKHNIIPTQVHLQITVRSFKDDVRQRLLEGIERVAKAAALGARAPEPIVQVSLDNYTPALYNDPALARKSAAMLKQYMGKERVLEVPPILGGEDFSRFGRAGVPSFFYFIGTVDPQKHADSLKPGAAPLPSMHSDLYAPVPDPSIRTGILSMSLAVLNVLKD